MMREAIENQLELEQIIRNIVALDLLEPRKLLDIQDLKVVQNSLSQQVQSAEDEVKSLFEQFCAAPMEADLSQKKRFNFYQNYTDEYPLQCRTDMFDYAELLHNMPQ